MNKEPEDFESLRKLLALKKYEKPPPGYFDQLPNKIWARIEAEEAQPSWWERVFGALTIKPAVAYAFGLVVCGTLIIGIGSALKTDEQQLATPLTSPQENSAGIIHSVAPSATLGNTDTAATNPVTGPLFPPTKLQVQPTGFSNQ